MKHYINILTLCAISSLSPIVVQSQTLNPSYLNEMPAPARILAEIKGKDAEDTSERQMGAFRALVQMMDDMAWGLGHRYVNDADTRDLTPDERRIRLAYQTAYAELWHRVKNNEGHVRWGQSTRHSCGDLEEVVYLYQGVAFLTPPFPCFHHSSSLGVQPQAM